MWDMISMGFKVFIGVIAFLSIARFLYNDVIPYIKEGSIQSEVAKKGIAVDAYILSANQTTSWDGNMPVFILTFKFTTQDGRETQASLRNGLTFKEIEKYSEGNWTTIKYDPQDPSRISLYDKPIILEGK